MRFSLEEPRDGARRRERSVRERLVAPRSPHQWPREPGGDPRELISDHQGNLLGTPSATPGEPSVTSGGTCQGSPGELAARSSLATSEASLQFPANSRDHGIRDRFWLGKTFATVMSNHPVKPDPRWG